MDDLVAFLTARLGDLARIAEDGKAACAHVDLCNGAGGEWWEHFGHEDGPDLVLADIASKRQILALVIDPDRGDGYTEAYRDVVRLLAQPFAEHPDFREEWKP